MKVLIFGASCSGTTTLAAAAAQATGFVHLDTDDFFWVKSAAPFTEKRPPAERDAQMSAAFAAAGDVVVSGSLISWSGNWLRAFDLGVFLTLPHTLRMQRLVLREQERYGEKLQEPARKANFEAFMEWARQYDDPGFSGRNIAQHRQWLAGMTGEKMELSSERSVEENVYALLRKIRQMQG